MKFVFSVLCLVGSVFAQEINEGMIVRESINKYGFTNSVVVKDCSYIIDLSSRGKNKEFQVRVRANMSMMNNEMVVYGIVTLPNHDEKCFEITLDGYLNAKGEEEFGEYKIAINKKFYNEHLSINFFKGEKKVVEFRTGYKAGQKKNWCEGPPGDY